MEKHEKSSKQEKLRQFLVTVVANLSTLVYGVVLGWQSPYAPQLQNSPPVVGSEPMTDEEVSWLSGTMTLSGTIVTLLLSVIPDRFSRKRFGFALVLPLSVSWLLLFFATEHMHIYIARTLCGIAGGGIFFFVPTYISEISSDAIRGVLGSILVLSLNSGILLAYVLGGIMSFRAFAMVGLVMSLLYLIAFIFMPESPIYLVRQNRMREAARILTWLRAGDTLIGERMLSHIEVEVKEANTSVRAAKLSDLFRDRATIKGLIITLGLFGGQQFCGIGAVINYSETIFKIAGSSLSPNMSSIIVALIQLFGTYLSFVLVEHAGRRLLILISCAGLFICHCIIGTFCYFQELKYDVSGYTWIPIFALSLFMVTYALGMSVIPIVVMSEIFSRDVSSLGSAVGLLFLWISGFIVVKTFPELVLLLSMSGCFYLFTVSCGCSFLFYLLLMPETKGRMREDIVNQLNGAWLTIKTMKSAKHTEVST